jgi:hypothetical protein
MFDKFKVGQSIRAEDFSGRRDCYIEGEIIEVSQGRAGYPSPHYVIKPARVMWGGDLVPANGIDQALVPMYCFRDWATRVQVVQS